MSPQVQVHGAGVGDQPYQVLGNVDRRRVWGLCKRRAVAGAGRGLEVAQLDLAPGHPPQLVQLDALPQVVLQLLQSGSLPLWPSMQARFASLLCFAFRRPAHGLQWEQHSEASLLCFVYRYPGQSQLTVQLSALLQRRVHPAQKVLYTSPCTRTVTGNNGHTAMDFWYSASDSALLLLGQPADSHWM